METMKMIGKSISKFVGNFDNLVTLFKDCGYDIKYKNRSI